MERFRGHSRILLFKWLMMTILFYQIINVVCFKNDRQAGALNSLVKLEKTNNSVIIMSNGILRIAISIPEGNIKEVQYNNIDNLLEFQNNTNTGGYWDLNWNIPGMHDTYESLKGTSFKIITQNDDQAEISFSRNWQSSSQRAPLNIDKRYIMKRGISGFYTYAIYERIKGWPAMHLSQTRIVFKLKKDKFHYMGVKDIQKEMPNSEDRLPGRSKVLDYKEAVLLTNPINPKLKGQVDDKYQYSCENQDNKVHGWVSIDNTKQVGFWLITPSNEFINSGPIKQDLTSHAGPITLGMFMSTHYGGIDVNMKFRKGESWKKVFGPIFIYLNSSPNKNPKILWDDAQKQMLSQTSSWPYDFVQSQEFPSVNKRSLVSGQLFILDRYKNNNITIASYAFVGLALPGDSGSWQVESKGYQFWTRADKDGNFVIKNIRAGFYNLYAWVPGVIGDYKYEIDINIKEGSHTKLPKLVYKPPRDGPTLWEIGIPDRTANEFYIPDPIPSLTSHLGESPRYKQYGLWKRYTELFPKDDLVFNIGYNNYSKDWFYAHVTRSKGKTYESTTWKITFFLKQYIKGKYTLRLALASASESNIEIRFNNPLVNPAHFSTGKIGGDSAIARHGIHGLYRLFNINVPSVLLKYGNNTIFLTQSLHYSQFQGVMYDYIRLEGPGQKRS